MEIQTNTRCGTKRHKGKKRYKKNPCPIILLIMMIGVMIWVGTRFFNYYTYPPLTGRWVSKLTGKTIYFTEKGTVEVDNKEQGAYTIYPPNRMKYEIDGYTFDMLYEIDGRVLTWGEEGEESEVFERK